MRELGRVEYEVGRVWRPVMIQCARWRLELVLLGLSQMSDFCLYSTVIQRQELGTAITGTGDLTCLMHERVQTWKLTAHREAANAWQSDGLVMDAK